MLNQLLTPGAGLAAALGFVLGVLIDQAQAHHGRNHHA